MKIIKPGKIRKIKLKCDECGCEFTCNSGELTHIYGTAWAKCPQDGCGAAVEVPIGDERYITRVANVSKGVAELIKALGAETGISMMIDGKYAERFYMGDTGMLIAYKAHDGKLYE